VIYTAQIRQGRKWKQQTAVKTFYYKRFVYYSGLCMMLKLLGLLLYYRRKNVIDVVQTRVNRGKWP